MGTIINAKIDSELESVERSAKRITQKMLHAKTLAHSNKSKTLFLQFFQRIQNQHLNLHFLYPSCIFVFFHHFRTCYKFSRQQQKNAQKKLKNLFYKFCNHQQPERTKLLKSLYHLNVNGYQCTLSKYT
jgi:hypothetical protein